MKATDSYKSLSKYEKLQEIKELRLRNCERHEVAIYLKAIWLNDTKTIESYERFGTTPHKIFINKRTYERQLLFGFSDLEFSEYGWIENRKLLDYEIIDFKTKNQSVSSNSVSIGRGLNNKWTFGICYSTGGSGGANSASIWGEIVDSKEKAIILGLEKLLEQHNTQRERLHKKNSCGNYNEAFSNSIVKLVKEKLDEALGKKEVQLNLFDFAA